MKTIKSTYLVSALILLFGLTTSIYSASIVDESSEEMSSEIEPRSIGISSGDFDADRVRKIGDVLSVLADQLIPALLENKDQLAAAGERIRKRTDRPHRVPVMKSITQLPGQKACICA